MPYHFVTFKNKIANTMNKKVWIFSAVVIAAAVATSTVWLTVCKKKTSKQKKLAIVSDAGYETAYDVHFPMKPRRKKSPNP